MQVFSINSIDAFRDACVTLSRSRDVYSELVRLLGDDSSDSGHFRSIGDLVEAYYATVDWTDPRSYETFLEFFVEVYEAVPDSVWQHRQELSERLFADGLFVECGKLKRLPL